MRTTITLKGAALATGILLSSLAIQNLGAQAVSGHCKDGTTTMAKTKSGACRGHGGVKDWTGPTAQTAAAPAKETTASKTPATKAAVPAPAPAPVKPATPPPAPAAAAKPATSPAPAPAAPRTKATSATPATANGATAKCKDGTFSKAAQRRGACSRHGGVDTWLKSPSNQ
jgi:hypothetical protein